MTHIERAIRDAVEKGGYKNTIHSNETHTQYCYRLFLDLLFWKALGKARGWKIYGKHTMEGNNLRCSACGEKPHVVERCSRNIIGDWLVYWHGFIDHLADGKDAESFFRDL